MDILRLIYYGDSKKKKPTKIVMETPKGMNNNDTKTVTKTMLGHTYGGCTQKTVPAGGGRREFCVL